MKLNSYSFTTIIFPFFGFEQTDDIDIFGFPSKEAKIHQRTRESVKLLGSTLIDWNYHTKEVSLLMTGLTTPLIPIIYS